MQIIRVFQIIIKILEFNIKFFINPYFFYVININIENYWFPRVVYFS